MEAILNSHTLATLKGEIRKNNVKSYSKLNKSDTIKLMMEHKEKFSHIEMAPKKERKKKEKKKEKKEKPLTLTKADGSVITLKKKSI